MTDHFFISSSFRNRVLYPNPSSFTLNLRNQNIEKTIVTSTNPISNYPVYNFSFPNVSSSFDNHSISASILSIDTTTVFLNSSITQTIQTYESQNLENILKGLSLCIDIGDSKFS